MSDNPVGNSAQGYKKTVAKVHRSLAVESLKNVPLSGIIDCASVNSSRLALEALHVARLKPEI